MKGSSRANDQTKIMTTIYNVKKDGAVEGNVSLKLKNR